MAAGKHADSQTQRHTSKFYSSSGAFTESLLAAGTVRPYSRAAASARMVLVLAVGRSSRRLVARTDCARAANQPLVSAPGSSPRRRCDADWARSWRVDGDGLDRWPKVWPSSKPPPSLVMTPAPPRARPTADTERGPDDSCAVAGEPTDRAPDRCLADCCCTKAAPAARADADTPPALRVSPTAPGDAGCRPRADAADTTDRAMAPDRCDPPLIGRGRCGGALNSEPATEPATELPRLDGRANSSAPSSLSLPLPLSLLKPRTENGCDSAPLL